MRWRLLLALGIVTVTAWLLADFWAATSQQATLEAYSVDFHGAQWITPHDTGPRSYFRFSFNVDSPPSSAIVWIDAEQFYTAWVNNAAVSQDNGNLRTGEPALGTAIDVTQRLVVGINALTIQVTNRDVPVSALRARLTVTTGTHAVDHLTGPLWRATSNAALVKPRLDLGLPAYTAALFNDSQWGTANVVTPVRAASLSVVPTDVMDAALRASVLAAPHFARELVASTVIDVPADPTDAWVRVAASGPYDFFLDGHLMTARSEPLAPVGQITKARSVVLTLINLTSYLHSGKNVISIRVTANPLAAVYVDGRINTTLGTSVAVATGPNWGVTGRPFGSALVQPASTHGIDLGAAPAVWSQGVVRTVPSADSLDLPTGPSLSTRLLTGGGLIVAWLLFGFVSARIAGVPVTRGLLADAVGHIPGGFAIATMEQVSRLSNVIPPFPHTPVVLWLLIAALAAGKLAAATGVVLHRRPAAGEVRRWRLATPSRASFGVGRDRWRSVVERLQHHWNVVVIGGIAAVCGSAAAYALDYQPVWQDELASLQAAQGMRAHLLPMLPSSLVYWKGELYSILLAFIGAFTSDNVVALRAISVFWYIATILAFAFLLVPIVLPGRRKLQVALTLLFAIAPAELLWSRDMRMYQMAQFFFIIFLALFFRAMRRPQLRTIAGSAIALVVMYLSHEETFVFLPAVPIVFLAVMRLSWVRDWRWWVFGLGAFAIIGGQYALATYSHPPFFGFDASNKPFIEYDPSSSFYYLNNVYFAPLTTAGSLAIVSTLALFAGIAGVVRRALPRLYLSAFLWIAVLSLSVIFSPKVARYTFVTLPVLFALAGAGAADVIDGARRLFTVAATGLERRTLQVLISVALVPAFVWLTLTQATGMRDFGLAVARITESPSVQLHTDYGFAGAYVRAHEQPGDVLVSLAPSTELAFYVGRTPDDTIATSRNKLLYLMEIRGQVVDTTFGVPAILTANQLQQLIQTHRRIWIITDQSTYFNSVSPDITQLIKNQFDEVAEGAFSAVYFRDA